MSKQDSCERNEKHVSLNGEEHEEWYMVQTSFEALIVSIGRILTSTIETIVVSFSSGNS